mmetsp:Transcript_38333/g.105594  ORF Transcript_38333/g.105594 Transcript_38333/m.105594 type:complete len:241 (-) Transcript_38333:157-879(-)
MRVPPVRVIEILWVPQLGVDAGEGPCGHQAHDGVWAPEGDREDGNDGGDNRVGQDGQPQERLRGRQARIGKHACVHSARRDDPAQVQREGSAQQPVLGARRPKTIRTFRQTEEATQDAQHAHERRRDHLLGESDGPGHLEAARPKPPWRHSLYHGAAAEAGQHLGDGKDALTDEDWTPNAEGPPCGSHQRLILFAQNSVGRTEDAGQRQVSDREIKDVGERVEPVPPAELRFCETRCARD